MSTYDERALAADTLGIAEGSPLWDQLVEIEDGSIPVKSFTAVFTLESNEAQTPEEWKELISYLQDSFDNQWLQTVGSGQGWTITIHADDEVAND